MNVQSEGSRMHWHEAALHTAKVVEGYTSIKHKKPMQEHQLRERLTIKNLTHHITDDHTLDTTGGGKRCTDHGKTTFRSMEMRSKTKEWKVNRRPVISNRNVPVNVSKRKIDINKIEIDRDREMDIDTDNTLPGNFINSIKNYSEIREAIKIDNSELA